MGRLHRRRRPSPSSATPATAASPSSTPPTATATAAPKSNSARRSATTPPSPSPPKFGYDFYTHADARRGQREIPQDFGPAYIRKACDESLRRLKRDRIDFYQLHNPKMDTIERDETFAVLDDLVSEGKLRSYGVALGPAIGWERRGRARRPRT